MFKCALLITALSLSTVECFAQTGLAHCNAVLEGDLFNKVISTSQLTTVARQAARHYMYTRTENEAYDIYSKDYDNHIAQGQAGGVEVDYLGCCGNAEFSITYDRKLSSEEFKQKLRRAKNLASFDSSSSSYSSTSLATAYSSFIRDPVSINAWKECVTRDTAPGLYSFASRDDAGNASLNVIWVPGNFAGISPSIDVELSLPPGANVDDPVTEVAVGTGRQFRIFYANADKSFSVFVNGSLRRSDGSLVGSFQSSSTVPALAKAEDNVGVVFKQRIDMTRFVRAVRQRQVEYRLSRGVDSPHGFLSIHPVPSYKDPQIYVDNLAAMRSADVSRISNDFSNGLALAYCVGGTNGFNLYVWQSASRDNEDVLAEKVVEFWSNNPDTSGSLLLENTLYSVFASTYGNDRFNYTAVLQGVCNGLPSP